MELVSDNVLNVIQHKASLIFNKESFEDADRRL